MFTTRTSFDNMVDLIVHTECSLYPMDRTFREFFRAVGVGIKVKAVLTIWPSFDKMVDFDSPNLTPRGTLSIENIPRKFPGGRGRDQG